MVEMLLLQWFSLIYKFIIIKETLELLQCNSISFLVVSGYLFSMKHYLAEVSMHMVLYNVVLLDTFSVH